LIKAVLFDVIGTTVLERDPSLINTCFVSSFRDNGVSVSETEIRSIRGMNKEEAIQKLLAARDASPSLAKLVLERFHKHVSDNLHNFIERPEFPDLVAFLKRRKILIGVGTGLSSSLFRLIFDSLKWERYQFDFIGIADEVGAGRPDPRMLRLMMEKFKVQPHEFLKVGDTVADIEEGKNAGTRTAVLLAGTQDEVTLRNANPDFVLTSLTQTHALVTNSH
jgi:HAD superfamily hydrolase (TIGR01549 family)